MKKITLYLKSFIVFILLIGCTTLFAQSRASYTISFTSTWDSETNDPINGNSIVSLPGNAHWSDLVGATHNSSSRLLEMGSLASLGIKNVAEFGSNGALLNEVQSLIADGTADQFLQASFNDFAPRTTATLTNIEVSSDFPLLSLVSMIAPSPDWIIAIDGINLREGNAWVNSIVLEAFPYDAGTDSGSSYTSSNQPTTPNFEPISALINEGPFNDKPIGFFTITFNQTLSIDSQTITEIDLYPNPSKGQMNIKTSNSNIIDQVLVFDVLGKRVASLNNTSSENEFSMNLTNLKQGVYLAKLNMKDGSQVTKKIVIN